MFVINVENLTKASKCAFYIVSLALPTIILLYIHVIGMYGVISLSIDTYITLASVDIHFFLNSKHPLILKMLQEIILNQNHNICLLL